MQYELRMKEKRLGDTQLACKHLRVFEETIVASADLCGGVSSIPSERLKLLIISEDSTTETEESAMAIAAAAGGSRSLKLG